VVKVANSPLYGMEGRITRLERGVVILGVRTVAGIASSVLMQSHMRDTRLCNLPPNALWMHSLEIGACAELLARSLGWPQEPEAYLAGLLHDLGTLHMFQEHGPRYCEQLQRAQRSQLDLEACERESFGQTHGERLKQLAAQWGFPVTLYDLFEFHHRPLEAPEPTRALVSLVYAAHIVVEEPSEGWSDQGPQAETQRAILDQLGLSPDDLHDVRALLDERLKDFAAALRP
jgi:HD-like signal output (HDOD) protein